MKRGATASILILALWTLMVLAFLALAIGGFVSAGTQTARFLQNDATAMALAQGGVELAISDIMQNPSNFDATVRGDVSGLESRFRENASLNGGTFSVYYTFDDTNANGIVTNFGVLRESLKINIDNGAGTDTQRLVRVLDWLGAPRDLADMLVYTYPSNKLSQKTVAPEYMNRYGPYEAVPELFAVRGVGIALFEGLEPLVTLREFERRYPDQGDAWQRRESYGGIAEGRVMAGGAEGASTVVATRRITFVFDRVTTNLLYWREH
ncbi:MAG: hypothetical protein O3B24_04365 [Verrucomicrobia bacterium]|nr:hypothetical protein [Verrucomicrobiota bacterium]